MALPKILKHYNVFVDGVSYVGQAEEISLPKLQVKTNEWRSGGMVGEVEIDHGLQKIELEHTYGGFQPDVFKTLGGAKLESTMLRFAGSYQSDDDGAVQAVEIVVRGRHTEIDGDKAKAGDKSQTKVKTSCNYYKLTVDGATLVEVDMINMIYVVSGEDRMAEHRKAIGL